MVRYILKRLMYILIVFFILSFIIFCVYNMVPYDRAFEETHAEKTRDKYSDWGEPGEGKLWDKRYNYYQCQYGLNGGIVERYFRWLGLYPYTNYNSDTGEVTVGDFNGLLQGNLGYSFIKGENVADIMSEPMGNTMFLNIFATILGLGITIPLGIFCAVKRGSKRDIGVQVGTIIGYSIPVFIIGILFIWLFAIALPIFPVGGSGTLGADFPKWSFAGITDRLYYLALPLIVMTFSSLGGMTRYVRASMIESLNMDCIRTARAKGLSEKTVVYTHAFRNALIPIVTLVIGWFLGIFGGSIMIENLFGLNGIGKLYYTSLTGKDYDVVLALQMFYVLIGLLGNLLIDIAYGFVDPRIRVNK